MRLAVVIALLTTSVVTTVLSLTLLPFNYTRSIEPLAAFTALLWVLFALAVFALRRVSTKAAIVLVLAGSVAIGGAALSGPPNTSTDSARYAWDGIVQRAGVSPYDFVPTDPELQLLRPDWLFPSSCDGERIMDYTVSDETVCTGINRAKVPTIYPPAAELYYLGVRSLVSADATYWPLQVGGLLISLAVTALLLSTLVKRGRDPRWAALWGWSPLVATEAVTNSHVDALAALLLLAATVLIGSRHRWLGGIALGVSIATKLIPAIGAPPLLRRGWWQVALGAIGAFALLYVPYVAASGLDVLGYLPGYLGEEGYGNGKRFVLVSLIAPGPAAAAIAGLIIVTTAVIVLLKANPDDPWLGELVIIGVVLLTVSPRYAWYALLLIPMIAMTGRWEWLAVPLALTERLLNPSIPAAQVSIFLAVVLIAVVSLRRRGLDTSVLRDPRLRHPLSRWRKSTRLKVTDR